MKRRRSATLPFAYLLFATFPSVAFPSAPTSVPYVGYLSYDSGVPYEGSVSVSAAVYGVATPSPGSDAPLWGPHAYGELQVSRGVLSFVLGADGSPPVTQDVLRGSVKIRHRAPAAAFGRLARGRPLRNTHGIPRVGRGQFAIKIDSPGPGCLF